MSIIPSFLGILLGIVSFSPAAMPKGETGNVDGFQAVLFWPTAAKGAFSGDLPPGDHCVVHTISRDSGVEAQFPCGTWLLPKDGTFVAWLESDAWISGQPIVFRYGAIAFNGFGVRIEVPVVPEGTAKVTFAQRPPATATIRFLSLASPSFPLERRVPVAVAEQGIHLPARPAIAGVFDGDDNAIAISRSFAVAEGRSVNVPLSAPVNGADVLAVLARPAAARAPVLSPAHIFLESGSSRLDADFVYHAPSRIYAVWYGVSASAVTLKIESKEVALGPVKLTLKPGRAFTVRRELDMKREAEVPKKETK
jgi:hypothetical protein